MRSQFGTSSSGGEPRPGIRVDDEPIRGHAQHQLRRQYRAGALRWSLTACCRRRWRRHQAPMPSRAPSPAVARMEGDCSGPRGWSRGRTARYHGGRLGPLSGSGVGRSVLKRRFMSACYEMAPIHPHGRKPPHNRVYAGEEHGLRPWDFLRHRLRCSMAGRGPWPVPRPLPPGPGSRASPSWSCGPRHRAGRPPHGGTAPRLWRTDCLVRRTSGGMASLHLLNEAMR